jgi:Domain of unknown function (DUF1707)
MSNLRIGDSERNDAVTALGEHYLAGRLTKEEYDDRTDAVWAARTQSDLKPLFVDLPKPATVIPPKTSSSRPKQQVFTPASRRRRPHITRFVLIFVALLVFTPLHMPWWAWLLLLWAWMSGLLASAAGSFRRARR